MASVSPFPPPEEPAPTSAEPSDQGDPVRIKEGRLVASLPPDAPAEQRAFVAEAATLVSRVARHKPWASADIYQLITAATTIATRAADLPRGEALLKTALAIYQKEILRRNRLKYFFGSAVGALLLVGLAAFVVQLGQSPLFAALAKPDMLIALFAFSGIGSLTSVLTRLDSLDLREETSKTMLFIASASKPLIAMVFASIVYIALKGHLVAISFGGTNGETSNEAFWIAAFLCGFSERFASEIIAKLDSSSNGSRK